MFWSYLPHPDSKSCTISFFDSLLFKEHSVKFSNFFSTVSIGWEPIQPNHCASLYEALVLVILEPKSYLVRAHKLHISPRHGLGPVVGHFVGCLQPTLSPFGFLVVKQMWPAFDPVSRGVFMELGSPRLIGGVLGTEGMKNGVSLHVYEGKREAKKSEEERGERRGRKEMEEEKKNRKKKMRRDFSDSGGSALSHFKGGFPKVLREWISGFGGRKEGRQKGSSRESYRYERCVLLPFLLRLSLPLMFAA